ncbi:CoA-binding protein [Microbacterium invictum]|uniref:CoA-binding protein n=1 Tax=Microbacterium invictum TaxID=515415 RepID=A0ABZ0V5W0_9MICO|nr:CoA-binding protein [Microbacterium invictum]WQB68963.1 CoA-binding protein [Microbacterium invictum]
MTDASCALPAARETAEPLDTPATADGAFCALPSAPTPGRTWQGPGAQERFEILRRTRSIAIVGASDNPARASYFVASYLLGSAPYDVYFVNPRADTILGRPAYASLADLPVAPDLVDVFRRHDDLPGVAAEAVAAGAKTLWLQLGSWHEGAAAIAEDAGLSVVMDRCVKIEHARFHGGLHLAGFDTGVISSRRQLLSRRADL